MLKTNKADSFKYSICEDLYELYNSSKKYYHGADDGSFLGISWIDPNEIEFYNTKMESIIYNIQSLGVLRTVSA